MTNQIETRLKMKKCPYCQSDIPVEAKKCPRCQSDLRNWFERHPVLTIFGGLIIFIIGISIISGGAKKEGNIKTVQQPTVYLINQDVRVGDVRWKVLEAKDLGSHLRGSQSRYPSFQKDVTTTGKFIKVRFEIENLGQELKSVTWLRLIDSQNREYVPRHDVSAWIPENEDLLLIENLNPNIPKTLTVIFEVAKDASGLKFIATDLRVLGAGVKKAFIDLGL